MLIKFSIGGRPVGKGRPRFKKTNKKVVTYTPNKTRSYEEKVRNEYFNYLKHKFAKNTPIGIAIEAFYEIPKDASKETKQKMLEGKILPTIRPDGDNLIKIILDALNGVGFHDDSQVCVINFKKKYAELPMVKVTIADIEFNC